MNKITLDNLKVGKSARVIAVNSNGNIRRRLLEWIFSNLKSIIINSS